jgi:phosphoribosylglycinamide formyltransferase 1
MKSIVILISGRGSNLGAILDAKLPAKLSLVISNNPDAAGLKLAEKHGVPTLTIDHRIFSSREQFDQALIEAIAPHAPDLVLLAGFMRVLSDKFVNRFRDRLLNIHPSLLPAFAGLNTHARALKAGVKIHGCSVHFVTSTLDGGPIIAQAAVPVLPDDDEKTLASRVLAQEHRIYPKAIRWFLEGKLLLANHSVQLRGAHHDDGAALINPMGS